MRTAACTRAQGTQGAFEAVGAGPTVVVAGVVLEGVGQGDPLQHQFGGLSRLLYEELHGLLNGFLAPQHQGNLEEALVLQYFRAPDSEP